MISQDAVGLTSSVQHAVKKLSVIKNYASGQYMTEKLCDKVILENGGKLKLLLIVKKIKNV